jgi:hypothetical protein
VLTGQLSELEAAERVLARYSKGGAGKKDAVRQDAGGQCSEAAWAPPRDKRKTRWRQAQFADPR